MRLRLVPIALLLLCTGCLLIPSDQETGRRVGNTRPVVRITAGADNADSSGIDYKVTFQWRGADVDGVVTRFQYAIDDTTTQTAWHDTTAYSVQLLMKASHYNPHLRGVPPDTSIFSDWHTFYIRAVDNEYATSTIDRRYFNARTIAPSSHITFPLVSARTPLVRTFVVDWTGDDLDSASPQKEPAFYEYKLLRIPNRYVTDDSAKVEVIKFDNTLLDTLQGGDHSRWIRVDGKTKEAVLTDLPESGANDGMIFAVRAVDEAGATEPVLTQGRNYFVFTVTANPGKPNITITERALGGHTFPRQGDVWGGNGRPVEVPTNTPVRFQWVGDASFYGSKPGNTNYGLDVPDPENDRYSDPRGIGGWIGWGKWTQLSVPFIFPDTEDGQQHVFYLRMRDASDKPSSERLCTVVMKIVAFRFDRTVLLVDDDRMSYGLNAQQQDAVETAFTTQFTQRMVAFAPDGIDVAKMYTPSGGNPEGRAPTQNTAITLGQMAHYSTMLWSYNYSGGSDKSGIWFEEHEENANAGNVQTTLLSSYVSAGGKLFLFGGRFLSAIVNPLGNAGGQYPKIPPQAQIPDFSESSFLWRFLHIRDQVVGIDPLQCAAIFPNDHQLFRDGLLACVSRNPAYPDLYLDPARYDTERQSDQCPTSPERPYTPQGGIRDWEGNWQGNSGDPDGAFYPHVADPGLDTLYVAKCYDWKNWAPSIWDQPGNEAVVAQRYHATHADTLSGNPQGRIVMFMFQPYPFLQDKAVEAGTAAINWLMTGQDH